jgi:hypothetical protein
MGTDVYRLVAVPKVDENRYRLRIREEEWEVSTLDEIRLIALDHAPGDSAYAVSGTLLLGVPVPAARVTRAGGGDITALVDGSSAGYFVAEAGESLYVQFTPGISAGAFGANRTQEGGPGMIDDGDKGGGGAPSPMPPDALGRSSVNADAEILQSTGVLVQVPDGLGDWRTVLHHYPREEFSVTVLDSVSSDAMRLVYLDRHKVRYIGRVALSAEQGTQQLLGLLSAEHSRLGTVTDAVQCSGGTTAALVPGDTLTLEFAASPIPVGKVREWFLTTRGGYASARSSSFQSFQDYGLPTRFTLLQNRPNPFRGNTTVAFELPAASPVQVEVFDPQGRRVRTLVDQEFPAGFRQVDWDRRDVSGTRVRPGVYFCTMIAGSFRAQKKMVILP